MLRLELQLLVSKNRKSRINEKEMKKQAKMERNENRKEIFNQWMIKSISSYQELPARTWKWPRETTLTITRDIMPLTRSLEELKDVKGNHKHTTIQMLIKIQSIVFFSLRPISSFFLHLLQLALSSPTLRFWPYNWTNCILNIKKKHRIVIKTLEFLDHYMTLSWRNDELPRITLATNLGHTFLWILRRCENKMQKSHWFSEFWLNAKWMLTKRHQDEISVKWYKHYNNSSTSVNFNEVRSICEKRKAGLAAITKFEL